MLGGGRGGNMSMVEFSQRIRDFVREPISLPNRPEEHVFVIGAIDASDFITRLRAYVSECERLCIIARENAEANGSGTDNAQHDNVPNFSPEVHVDGTGTSQPSGPRTIKHLHGRVVRALKKKMGNKAFNSAHNEMRPDLYLTDASGRMHTLFEVKVSSDTQSWFTALGQLVVYGAGEASTPRRIFVCPAIRKDPNFQKALAQLSIDVVTFELDGEQIVFNGL
jgi:hypothetical protein